MRNETTWTVRLGIRFVYDTWTPFQWEGEDLATGIHAVCKAALKVSDDESLDDLYMLGLDLDTFVSKNEECAVNWGITVFKAQGYWFGLLGYREQYADGEWATAYADESIHAAVGQLEPTKTCSAVPWRQDMVHRVQPRNENGDFMSRTPEDYENRRKRAQAANQAIREAFHGWSGKSRWDELIAKANANRS
jgi:hypothetical protein